MQTQANGIYAATGATGATGWVANPEAARETRENRRPVTVVMVPVAPRPTQHQIDALRARLRRPQA